MGSSGCISVGQAEYRTFTKDFTVSGTTVLDIQNGSGDVTITPGAADRVRVKGEVRMQEFLFETGTRRRIEEVTNKPPISQMGTLIRIVRPVTTGPGGVRINYIIEVPSNSEVRVRNGSGDVATRDLQGPINVHTASGDILISNIQQRVDATAGSGDVKVVDVRGDVNISTRSGEVEIDNVRGDIRAETGSGDVRIDRPGSKVHAQASSGDIEIDGVSADLRVSTGSGEVHVVGDPAANSLWEINTRSGEAVLDVSDRASFQLHARSRSEVDSDIQLTIEEKTRRELRGRIGKGEARVRVETGSGRIRLR